MEKNTIKVNTELMKHPTKEIISAVKAVFQAMALVETIKPIVEKNKLTILNKFKYKYDPKHIDLLGRRGLDQEFITDLRHDYLMSDTDFGHYVTEVANLNKLAGLKHENNDPNMCPLLAVESILREAKRVLIDVLEPVTGISFDDLIRNFKYYESYIDLQLRYFVKFVKK